MYRVIGFDQYLYCVMGVPCSCGIPTLGMIIASNFMTDPEGAHSREEYEAAWPSELDRLASLPFQQNIVDSYGDSSPRPSSRSHNILSPCITLRSLALGVKYAIRSCHEVSFATQLLCYTDPVRYL